MCVTVLRNTYIGSQGFSNPILAQEDIMPSNQIAIQTLVNSSSEGTFMVPGGRLFHCLIAVIVWTFLLISSLNHLL